MKEYEIEEDLVERVAHQKRYKNIIELTKVIKEVETTSIINKMAVFPEDKREYVMSILKTEESVINPSGQINDGVKNLSNPHPKQTERPPFRRALSKYLDSKNKNSKVFKKK